MIKITTTPPLSKSPISRFPNGEAKVESIQDRNWGHDQWKWETDSDLIELFLLKALNPWLKVLNIMYMPYSRMDRDKDDGSRCSLRYIGEFIRSMNWDMITVLDPHSEVTMAYLGDNAFAVNAFHLLREQHPEVLEDAVLMFPDAGAQKRYGSDTFFKSHPQMVGKENKVNLGKHAYEHGTDTQGTSHGDLAAKSLAETLIAQMKLNVNYAPDKWVTGLSTYAPKLLKDTH